MNTKQKIKMLALVSIGVMILSTVPVLAFSPADGGRAIPAAGTLGDGKQVMQRFDSSGNTWSYYAYLPPNYSTQTTRRWPFIMMLSVQGATYEARDIYAVIDDRSPYSMTNGGVTNYLRTPDSCKWVSDSFVVITPWLSTNLDACANNTASYAAFFLPLLSHLKGTLRIDAGRFNIMGYCFGGALGYKIAALYPAMVTSLSMWSVNSANGGMACTDVSKACLLNTIKIRQYWGTNDNMVPYQNGIALKDAIVACGQNNIVWTQVAGAPHECWNSGGPNPTDKDPALYTWMLQVPAKGQTGTASPGSHRISRSDSHEFLNTRISKGELLEVVGLDGRCCTQLTGTGLSAATMVSHLNHGAYVIRRIAGSNVAGAMYLFK
jgi:predicted peptidase